jgi:1-acyl-sn-glycerol-3-phosphate acyltransferase
VKNGFGAIGRYGYAAYVGLALCITVPPVWFLIFIFPRKQAASWLSHVWAKGFLKSIGCPLSVKGKEHLGKATPMVLVSNHASYLDAVVLMAILPPGFLFVAKYQLLRAPIIRTVIQRVGHITVDREDLSKSVSDAKKIEDALRAGSSVLIFPEATFTPVTGLRPFKLGAFKVAAETSRPVCPISIHGTRYILWGDQWVPRRGSISVVIGEPIIPRENSWREITRLRDLVKFEIAKHCGENPLNLVGMGPPTS